MDILNLLEEDKKERRKAKNNNGKLFSIKDISPYKYTPSLRHVIPYYNYENTSTKLYNYPFLKDGIIIAGGKALHMYLNNVSNEDVDIFIYKDHDSNLNHLYKYFNNHIIYRTKYYINFINKDNRKEIYQVILRKYNSINQILYGFDIGASQIGFSCIGVQKFHFTVLSKFALETQYNVVDTTRRSLSYEWRLEKYNFHKNFGIIFPFLKYSDKFQKVNNMTIMKNCDFIKVDKSFKSDYNDNNYDSEEQIIYCNLDLNLGYIYGYSNYFVVPLEIKDNIYDIDWELIYVDHGYLSYNLVHKLDNNKYLFKKEFLKLKEMENNKEYIKLDLYKKKVVSDFIKKYKSFNFVETIKWIELDPSTQLTGSFNPVFEDPVDWYREHYYPPWSKKDHKYRKDMEKYIFPMINFNQDIVEIILKKLDPWYD